MLYHSVHCILSPLSPLECKVHQRKDLVWICLTHCHIPSARNCSWYTTNIWSVFEEVMNKFLSVPQMISNKRSAFDHYIFWNIIWNTHNFCNCLKGLGINAEHWSCIWHSKILMKYRLHRTHLCIVFFGIYSHFSTNNIQKDNQLWLLPVWNMKQGAWQTKRIYF
jgi:hypothetical protein